MALEKDWFSIESNRSDSVLSLACAVGDLIRDTQMMPPSRDPLRAYGIITGVLQLELQLSISLLRNW